MRLSFPSRLAASAAACAVAVICAVMSVLLWVWSSGLTEPNWESADEGMVFYGKPPIELPASEPPREDAHETASAAPKSQPLPAAPKPAPSEPAPSPEAAAPVAVEAPSPEPTVPPVTPTPDPSPVVAAAATPEATPKPVPPRPSDAELAGPLPEHSPGEAVSAAAARTPAPAARLEIADIARQPRLWPREVVLAASQRFPVVLNGVNVGNVQVPAGRSVLLRKVNADGTLEIEFQGAVAKVKARATDLIERAMARAAAP